MEWWQIIVGIFFVVLPIVLMLDFWGDERLTADGKPIERDWFRQIEHEQVSSRSSRRSDLDEAASHGEMVGMTGSAHAVDSSDATEAASSAESRHA